jgi:hypothetical protein
MVPLFVNVGSRDGVRPADIVGSIASQPGLSSADVGKIDVRESHTVVEVSAGSADLVIEKLTGSSIRGRRAIARRDEGSKRDTGRGARDAGGPRREFGGGKREGGDRGRDRSPRGGSRGPRDSSRESRPPRPESRVARPPSRRDDE